VSVRGEVAKLKEDCKNPKKKGLGKGPRQKKVDAKKGRGEEERFGNTA